MQMFLTILVLGCAVATVHGKVFSRCELATTLVKMGLSSRALINDWVCLVESESSRNTAAVGAPNSNGSQDFGLFQINDKYWCKHGVRGNDCNLECSELLTDDITAAVTCSKKIYARHGFTAWHGWTRKCDGQAIVDVSYCFA